MEVIPQEGKRLSSEFPDHLRRELGGKGNGRPGNGPPVNRPVPMAYYMGGMDGIPPPSFSSSGFSTTIASVVSRRLEMLAAFCRAERTTLPGSTMPAFIISTNFPDSTS